MSIPLDCPGCGECIGAGNALLSYDPSTFVIRFVCPGKGKHKPPVRTTERKCFGLVDQVTVEYPETGTRSSWNEYAGPKRWLCLWFALMFGSDSYGLFINHMQCWWSFKRGFYGDGAKEFQSA